MTSVLRAWREDEPGGMTPPPGCIPEREASLTILARAKLSYAPPNLPRIWIKRRGFAFEHFVELAQSREQIRDQRADQVERFLIHELTEGRYHTPNTIETLTEDLRMSRGAMRAAIASLRASGRVIDKDLPDDLRHGGRKTYLHPTSYLAATDGEVGAENTPCGTPIGEAPYLAAAYRDETGGEVAPPVSPLCPTHFAAQDGEVAARWLGSPTDDNAEYF